MTESNRCTTSAGQHRCKGTLGHSGPCESQAPEYDTSAAMKALEGRIRVLECEIMLLKNATRVYK